MIKTPPEIIHAVIRDVYAHDVESLTRLTHGGLNETYRVACHGAEPVIARIARRPTPWFTDEAYFTTSAREVGVPAPEVLGVRHIDHGDELLSFSILTHCPGQPLAEIANTLTRAQREHLIMSCGELLGRLHSITPDRGARHVLNPDEEAIARAIETARDVFGERAASIVTHGAELLRDRIASLAPPTASLAHGDWFPKHFMVEDHEIVAVLDWEFARIASPAFDLGRWEVSAGADFEDTFGLLARGYSRTRELDADTRGWVPAFAIDWALEILGWRNPATRARMERCVNVIARHGDKSR